MNNYAVKYDISARANGKSDYFSGEFTFTLDQNVRSNDGFELHQLGEKIERGLATEEDLVRIQVLVKKLAGETEEDSDLNFDTVIDAVMEALSDKGVQSEDPGEDGWYINRDDLSVRVVGNTILVEGAASWG